LPPLKLSAQDVGCCCMVVLRFCYSGSSFFVALTIARSACCVPGAATIFCAAMEG